MENPAKLPGDADVIATGRVGKVYRKLINGVDVVCKVLRIGERESKAEWSTIREEMEREREAYERLEELQGRVVPRFLLKGGILGVVVFLGGLFAALLHLVGFLGRERRDVRDRVRW